MTNNAAADYAGLLHDIEGRYKLDISARDVEMLAIYDPEWRQDYNHVRPHSSLGYLTPMEFIQRKGECKTNIQLPQDAVCARLLTVAR